MSKYFVPVEIDGKWWVVENAPDKPPVNAKRLDSINGTIYDELLSACTKYPTLQSDSDYWKSKEGVKMTSGEFEVKEVFCHANRDGECSHKDCPQLRDNEPYKSGRSCPLDDGRDPDEDFTKYAVIPGTHRFNYKTPIPLQHPTTKELIEQEAERNFSHVQPIILAKAMQDIFKSGATFALSLPKQDNGDAWGEAWNKFKDKYGMEDVYVQTLALFNFFKDNYSISKK